MDHAEMKYFLNLLLEMGNGQQEKNNGKITFPNNLCTIANGVEDFAG